jgi:uncharacterized membrane protein
MKRVPILLLPALLLVTAPFAFIGFDNFPDPVAVHFDGNGSPDFWISRSTYRYAILFALIGLPLLLVALTGILPRYTNGRGQIPNCEHWFAGNNRRDTVEFLNAHASWLGCFTVAVVYGLHLILMRSNAIDPPHLDVSRALTVIALYLFGLGWWFIKLMQRFNTGDR